MQRGGKLTLAAAALATLGSVLAGAWFTHTLTVTAVPGLAADAAATRDGPVDRAELERRVDLLEAQLERQPGDIASLKALGRSYIALGRLIDAVGVFSEAAQRAPNDPEIRGALADLATRARASGKHESAMQEPGTPGK